MTRKRLEGMVRVWQGRLGLERWKIEVDWSKPLEDGDFAEVTKSSTYDSATLRFSSEFGRWARPFAEATVVHELLHLCHRDVDQAIYDLDGQLHRDAWAVFDRRYDRAMESFVDRLAWRLVELAGCV